MNCVRSPSRQLTMFESNPAGWMEVARFHHCFDCLMSSSFMALWRLAASSAPTFPVSFDFSESGISAAELSSSSMIMHPLEVETMRNRLIERKRRRCMLLLIARIANLLELHMQCRFVNRETAGMEAGGPGESHRSGWRCKPC